MSEEYVFVDLQGFCNYQNRFIVKEFAIATSEFTQVYLVKPPFPFSKLNVEEKKQVRWLERKRGIFWGEGFIDYREFKRIVKPILEDKHVIVKGREKVKWVNEMSPHCCKIIDIGDKGSPNLANLCEKYGKNKKINCFDHKKFCALKNVLCIKEWYCDNNTMFFSL